MTLISPGLSNVTGVEVPGAKDFRLNSLPAVVDITLCEIVSSFTNTSVSPFFNATSDFENLRSF